MLATTDAPNPDAPPIPAAAQKRAIKILAKSLYRELSGQGYDEKQIVALATELLGEVATRMEQAENRS